MAEKANVNQEVMQFTLMGHPSCNRTEGGCRNAFLLLTQGKLALQTDDDTICRIGQPPIVHSELSLTSKSNSDQYWFFQSFEEATKSVDALDTDFLGLHEKILGKSLETVILSYLKNDEVVDIEKLHSSFLKNIKVRNSTVRMSLVGPVGDTCLFTDLNRLFLKGNALHRLLYPKEAFSWHLSTRQVIRSVTRSTISNFPRCIGMNFAIDNRSLLPPFMPVQARCDGIFGDLLKVCFPGAFDGSLPYVLEHNPPEKRGRSVNDLFSLTKHIRVNDIVSELIHSSEYWPYTINPKKNLRTLGRFMIDLANLKKDDFEKRVRQIYVSRKVAQIQIIEQHLYQSSNDTSYLADHFERYIKALRESISGANFLLPADIDNPKSDNHEDFKEIVLQLGSMLFNWPDIYKTIRSFHQDEMLQYITKIGKEKINN